MRLGIAVVALSFISIVAADEIPRWSYYPGYFLPGQNGIVVSNIDGIGLSETVITGSAIGGFSSTSKLHLATLESIGGSFQTTNMTYLGNSETFSGFIRSVTSPPGMPDRIIASVRNTSTNQVTLVTWSGKPLREVRRVNVPNNFKLSQIADVDGDGDLDALGCLCTSNEGFPILLNLATGSPKWTGPQLVREVAAGQLDSDAALEIVLNTANSGPGLILDGATRSQQWSYPDGFRGRIVFGNFRGDSAAREFAVVEYWGLTRVFVSTPIFSPVVELPSGEAQAVEVADINSDGYDDIVIGEGQWGAIRAYSTISGAVLRSWPRPNHGVSAIALGQLDAIPGLDLVYGSGLTSSGEDTLHVVDSVSGIQRYVRADESGPHSSVLLVDTDGDGTEELVFATTGSNSGSGGSNLRVLDSATGVERRSRLSITNAWSANSGLAMRSIEIDGDAAREIVIATGDISGSQIAVIDGVTLQDQWRVATPGVSATLAVEPMRFNADEIDDIVAAGSGRVVILNGATGAELFRSVSFQTTAPMAVSVGQADADAQLEIVISTGATVYVIDPTLGLVESFFSASGVLGLSFENIAGSCRIVAARSQSLDRHDCASGALMSQRNLGLTAQWVGITTNSFGSLVLSDGKRLYRAESSSVSSQSVQLGDDLGARNRGAIRIQGSALDVWVGSAQSVNHVRLPLDDSLFRDGFESF